MTLEADAALRGAGIEPILLKGPALEGWTLPQRRPRRYSDSDLLVSPRDFARAAAVLRELGFAKVLGLEESAGGQGVAEPWLRASDGANVDLHQSIIGMAASPQRVWDVLCRHTRSIQVGGRTLRCLDDPALALHVALHAVQQGEGSPHVRDDIEGALALAERHVWEGAVAVARQVDAVPALAAGLRTHPAGADLADELDLPTYLPVEILLRRTSETPLTLGIEALLQAPGWRARLRLLARELFPSRTFMRLWAPRLRRLGPIGLVAAYIIRVPWMLVHAPRALVTWRRARRASAKSR